jgi:hypothetical protein
MPTHRAVHPSLTGGRLRLAKAQPLAKRRHRGLPRGHSSAAHPEGSKVQRSCWRRRRRRLGRCGSRRGWGRRSLGGGRRSVG